MNGDATIRQAEQLIGGWVAGTLTEAERALLLRASLSHQVLFDAMADEEGLRELLADPAVRRELIAVLAREQAKAAAPMAAVESWWSRLFRPGPMAAFSAGVLAVVALVVIRPGFVEQQEKKSATVSMPDAAVVMAPAQPAENEPAKAAQPAEKADLSAATRERRAEQLAAPPSPPPSPVAMADSRQNASGPTASAPADAKKEADAARDRLAKVSEPAPPVAAAPPPPLPAAPAVRPTIAEAESSATAASVRVDESKAKSRAAAAAPPFRYRVERFQEQPGGGQWVEYGGELGRGAQARLAIEAARNGMLTFRAGADAASVLVQAGQTVFYPAAGSLPSGSGEREVAILFRAGAAPGGGALGELGSAQTESPQSRVFPVQGRSGAAGRSLTTAETRGGRGCRRFGRVRRLWRYGAPTLPLSA